MNALALRFSGGRSLDDWLSPILVKELRQGMRARVFVISFLLLQLFLGTLVLANVAAQYDRDTLEEQNHFFWVILGFALLVLTPLRSLVAISHEVKNRTMETVLLTRLTAWRVVFGKWSALFAQSLLLVSAVLPYVVLRYFIGGDDIVSDLEWILVLLWFSGVLIAAGIAISALTNVIIRIVISSASPPCSRSARTIFSGRDSSWAGRGRCSAGWRSSAFSSPRCSSRLPRPRSRPRRRITPCAGACSRSPSSARPGVSPC